MQFNRLKANLKIAVQGLAVLLLGAGWAAGQQAVNLTAGPTSITMPDGKSVPMWGYSCGDPVPSSSATCAKLNPAASGWSPVIITVPTGQDLRINLTNQLSFTTTSGTNNIPTSLTIVGQVGGGLGSQSTMTASPAHAAQTLTWPASSNNPADGVNNPPPQGKRVQSFATEVAVGAAVSLDWSKPNAGTYLLESGTHPSIQGPMGLFGMVVVTGAPSGGAGTAYPGVNYNAEAPMLFSEIDPTQNARVDAAVRTAGFSETRVWSGQPNTCGDPASATYNTCYPPAVNYSPRYYLINGVGFDKSRPAGSTFAATAGTTTSGISGTVLVRLVNAGLRMHVPSIVNSQTGASAQAGFGLVAQDGNPLPGVTRVQSEVFMAPGKTYDVTINVPPAGSTALPIFDREGSLSGNARERDAGMLAYISVNGAAAPSAPAAAAKAVNDVYNSVFNGKTLSVSDITKGLIANDSNVYSVAVSTAPSHGTVTLQTDGTFTYTPSGSVTSTFTDTFGYCANGLATACATVTLNAAPIETASGISVNNDNYVSNLAKSIIIKTPGVLLNDADVAGYPLSVSGATPSAPVTLSLKDSGGNDVPGATVSVGADGGFSASVPTPGTYTFTYQAKNSQGTLSSSSATVTLNFPVGSGLQVRLVDGKSKAALDPQDYRWLIEEDRTFYQNPNCTSNPAPAGCPGYGGGIVPAYGTNFHTSHMPVLAQGCTGDGSCEAGQSVLGALATCDVGNGICRTDATKKTVVMPGEAVLDPAKRYYISVLPGDGGDGAHAMGGAQVYFKDGAWQAVDVIVEPGPLPTATVSAFVFEDDFPMNGEDDTGGGVDVLAPNEPGLGGFNVVIYDNVGQFGDPAGQMTYDMFGNPLSNALAGTIDPATGKDACPIVSNSRTGFDGQTSPTGITGVITVCPKYESDGTTLSPLAGQAVVRNLPPGFYGVEAHPGADRIARGEEWLQTNTLDGGFAHDAFIKASEPSYFQEYGPAGFHVAIGFANPAIINGRHPGVCANRTDCTHTIKGKVTLAHMSRTPDERLYSTETNDAYAFTQTYVSLGSPDGADFAFAKTDDQGNFTFTSMPGGDWRVTVFDQWTDLILDGYTTPVRVDTPTVDMGDIAVHQWRQNLYTRTFFDENGDGVSQDDEPGLTFVPTNIRYRDGSYSNFNSTDLDGFAGFNEVFPIFNWFVVETDATRYKNTGTHVVYDAGGPVDGSAICGKAGLPACGSSTIANHLARTKEDNSLPADLRIPGSVYCDNADCSGYSIANGPGSSATGNLSTGRIDAPWVQSYGWQGFLGQAGFLEFGKKPFAAGENGGIHGHVVYASTRPFDDPALLLQLSWEPLVPNVTINLYQEGTAPDGSKSLKLVDSTQTSSWDEWAQGFRKDASGNLVLASDGKPVPNISCPGQSTLDPYYFTLYDQPELLNMGTQLPYHSQYKCYDGMHNWNQLQPAPYNGMYQFPSVTATDPQTGKPMGTNCTICTANHAADPNDWNYGQPMLPAGKYVVEMIVPPGYELVKEEDKNILMGDVYDAPVTQQFAGYGNIFIMPDQASISDAYNPSNPLIPSTDEGATPRREGDTGSVEEFWPCVGVQRIVPDYMSLYPLSGQNAPFAGATRPLCDRKEVALEDQMSVLAKFYVFTSTHIAGHFTGIITDDFTSEFDPFSPAFGEKFEPPYLPVSVKDWAGNEVSRVYSDQWGIFNGLAYSSWGVNPPDPSGFVPQTFVMCMNDRGAGTAPDPLYSDSYSQFCYEWPMMPGMTSYLDTPVVPNTAFAEGYNHPDCEYPDATPAISTVTSSDIAGPWVSAAGHTLTINSLGDQAVSNNGYSGPSASTPPFNQKTIMRHYGFGGNKGSVSIGGIKLSDAQITGWSDSQITVTVPSGIPACSLQQQPQYTPAGTTSAQCGELVITSADGKQSIDTVTITVGGKMPSVLAAGQTIQSAIDAAAPGDMIIVPPGTYKELLIMWKPVRLQGSGAASTVVDGNTHPSGVIDPWRHQISCLFGLALNGQPYTGNGPDGGTNPYDATNQPSNGGLSCPGNDHWNYFTATPGVPQVDRIPFEGILGWDTTVNGNLAEMLQEPTLMGSYEGAGITVLAKGVRVPAGTDWFGVGAEAGYPDGTTLLSANDCGTGRSGDHTYVANPFPSNFYCNPSRIDGFMVTNSSQGGGGILVHGWGHNIEISNNRVRNNNGTLSGGIEIGQGEFGDGYFQGQTNPAPGSCRTANVNDTQLPYCFNVNTNVHHNMVTLNSSTGDELFTSTPSGGGGVTFCIGSDYYKLNYNWICGNMSSGDGGGIAHLGFSYNGDISKNTILFNQSVNPTVPTSGGGIVVMGPAPDGQTIQNGVAVECGSVNDEDCVPGLSDGSGPGLIIDGNLILGNAAESGSGGGIRFQAVNGTDVTRFPLTPQNWYSVNVTNNIIANNVAGWDGGGVGLLDALAVNFVNNTIVSNDTTASAGTLFNAYFAKLASDQSPPPGTCMSGNSSCTASQPQPAGLSASPNSPQLTTSLPALIVCPSGHYSGLLPINGDCKKVSYPSLSNDIFWQNRAFHLEVGGTATGGHDYLQSIVTLAPSLNQPQTPATTASLNGQIVTGGTGACLDGASYWDIGVRGDTGPTNHSSGFTLTPQYSVLTSLTGYTGHNNQAPGALGLASQYCNGSRIPPEYASGGYQVPPGTNEGTVPVPVFGLLAGATVDEGNNWVNMKWGPLAMTSPMTPNGATLGNYSPAAGSPAIDAIPVAQSHPLKDFFGNPRPSPNNLSRFDAGAVEFQSQPVPAPTLISITPSTGYRSTSITVTLTGTNLTGTSAINVSGLGGALGITVSNLTVVNSTTVTATFQVGLLAGNGTRNITVTTPGGTSNAVTFAIAPPAVTAVSPNSGVRGTSVPVTITGTGIGVNTPLVTVSGLGVSVSNVNVVNASTITATFAIATNAGTTARNVTVTSLSGSGTLNGAFTVLAPSVSGISPNSGARGATVPVTITGANLGGATGVTVSGSGVSVSGFTKVNSTTITATFTVAPGAGTGSRTVTVQTPGGSPTTSFTVTAAALAAISPASALRGGPAVNVTLTGSHLTGTTGLAVSGQGVTVSNLHVVNDTTVTATLTIAANAGASTRHVHTVNAGGATSHDVTFTPLK